MEYRIIESLKLEGISRGPWFNFLLKIESAMRSDQVASGYT